MRFSSIFILKLNLKKSLFNTKNAEMWKYLFRIFKMKMMNLLEPHVNRLLSTSEPDDHCAAYEILGIFQLEFNFKVGYFEL